MSREEVTGRRVSEIHPCLFGFPFDWLGTFSKICTPGQSTRFNKYFETVNRWFDITAFSDEPSYFAVVFRDISDGKRAEAELAEREEQSRTLFESASVSILIHDYNTMEVVAANQRALDSYGAKDLEDLRQLDIWGDPPYSFSDAQSWFALVMAEGPERFEWKSKDRHGRVFWEDVLLKKITLQGVSRIMSTSVDITDRKRAEEELSQLKAFNESIVQNINEGIIMTDEVGKTTFVNPALPAMLGYTASELIGKPWTLLVSHDKRPVVELADDRRKDGQIDRYELVLQHKTGTEIPVLISGSPRYNTETGEFIGTLAVITNIADRKQAEESILYISYHDSLTHLYNRAYLEETMQRLDTDRQLPASIIIADLNGLKLVNDTFGHDAGDRMLKAAAEILRKSCRKEDVIARWGGDEFVIFLPQTSEENAKSICRRIKNNCRKVFIEDVPLSVSLGVTVKQKVGVDLVMLLNEAEDDMYKHKLTEGRRERRSLLKALLKSLENKSFETRTHIERMQKTAMNLGKAVGLSRSELNRLRLLINLHDIGKITIPGEILNKKGPLTPHEWAVIRKHPETGYRIARASEEFAHVAEDLLAHHERWDGSGYPQGLKGDDIPLLARITAVVDAWEIMSAGSAYKQALPKNAVAAEILRCAGSQFDPELAEIFLSTMKE